MVSLSVRWTRLYKFTQESAKLGVVATEAGGRGSDVTIRVKTIPGNFVTRVASELAEERSLGSAVAFPEWVDRVYLTNVMGKPVGE
jgi:hypothetical protein